VTLHSYGTGVNLIAEKKSAISKDGYITMITAHLDTVMTAGADDNGSGITTALTVARALAQKELSQTIRIVAFDEEERGLVGSGAYARHLAQIGEISKIRVINLEMTGYDSDDNGDFHAIDCNENISNQLTQSVLSAISSVGLALHRVEACTNRSDHASFWNYDRPAIVLSQNFFGGDGNPCYHRSCDTISKINFGYLTKLTQAVANAVYQIAH
jgi:Zn-dependent M28 family amino/carboxypeptidase